MAIQFARIQIVSRASGGNSCCKSAYNARAQIKDQKSNITYNFTARGDNVYHNLLLPENADQRFKSLTALMNEVEFIEKRKNSQLLKDIVIALPDDKELDLQDRINIAHEIIDEMGWVRNGLAVQIDIHQPHDGEKNWHAHLLVLTRRFTLDGKSLGEKARDLNPEFKTGISGKNFIIPEEEMIHERGKRIINDYFKKLGLDNRVDAIGTLPQEHIGPIRMRNILNQAVVRNEFRKRANIEHINSGVVLLEHVTRDQSIFTKRDLARVAKIIEDKELREQIINEALSSPNIIALYEGVERKAIKTQYFTTKMVRKEEERIMRIAGRIKVEFNQHRIPEFLLAIKQQLKQSSLNEAQQGALEEVLLGDGALRILKGRAGTGKTYLLGIAHDVAKHLGQCVIGLAPTHKAVSELQAKGFDQTWTVKGFLFGINNGRIRVPRNGLIIVDEAGMLANADLQELLKITSSCGANLVLAGDERQLTSVQRGGMFGLMADQFGAYELSDIQRQDKAWGKQMAKAFADADTALGIDILANHEGIKAAINLEQSVTDLMRDWRDSKYDLYERLIISVKNVDVDILNEVARELLKEQGILKGKAYSIKRVEKEEVSTDSKVSYEFMAGDRVMFTSSNKDLQIQSGEFGTIIEVSKEQFKVQIDGVGKKLVMFNPGKDVGLRHGYAVTTYKSQGASVKSVYVLHNGAGNNRNTYVNLTRHIEEVQLYYNKEATKDTVALKQQLSYVDERKSSLNFTTKAEIEFRLKDKNVSTLGKVGSWLKSKALNIGDRLHQNHQYYQFELPKHTMAEVQEVLTTYIPEQVAVGQNQIVKDVDNSSALSANNIMKKDVQEQGKHQEQIAVGTSHVINQSVTGLKSKQSSSKDRFYTKVERAKNNNCTAKELRDYKAELEALKWQIPFKAETIVTDLLGPANKRLSNKQVYRYGKKGSLAVTINGSKAGTWYAFEAGIGGSMIDLVQNQTNKDFKASVEYLKNIVGIGKITHLHLVHDHELDHRYAKQVELKILEERKQKQKQATVDRLVQRSKDIEKGSVAFKYLSNIRVINCSLGDDIKTAEVYIKEGKGKYYPVVIAFARNSAGTITGGQQIILDKATSHKANLEVNKRSFGRIAGAFVEVGKNKVNGHNNIITIIAEGLETALSIKQALSEYKNDGINLKILCSLGIGNIKHYQPKHNEKIIIAADNDGAGSKTKEIIDNACTNFKNKGAIVHIISPHTQGDFNDVLQTQGVNTLKLYIMPAVQLVEQEGEKHYIYNNLNIIAKEKQAADTPQKIMQALAKEEKFLAELHETIKYKDNYTKELLKNIARAKQENQAGLLNQIYQVANYAFKEEILNTKELVAELKSDNTLSVMHQNIKQKCYNYHCNLLQVHCQKIVNSERIEHKDHKFDDIITYLNYWKKNVDHNLLPINDINRTIRQEQIKQAKIHKGHELDL